MVRIATVAIGAIVYLLIWAFLIPHPESTQFSVLDIVPDKNQTPYYREGFAVSGETMKAHAATVQAFNGHLSAYWYGGSDEGAKDVQVYQATFQDGIWSKARPLIGIDLIQQDLQRFVRKVGNPVIHHWPDGRIWLFFVSVSVGGWAGSSINYMESMDSGEHWGPVHRLITSPFFNVSSLVRNQTITYTDGSIGLPAYHELLGKFGELIRISPTGRILDKNRFSQGDHSLQPAIIPMTKDHAIGLMRYAGDPPMKLLQFESTDGGNTWSTPVKSSLPNPNAAIDAIRLADGRLLAIINDTVMGRSSLSLAVLTPLTGWTIFHHLEFEQVSPTSHEYEFSYPSITQDSQGIFHLLYSWNQQHIKHVTFNSAWLHEKMYETLHKKSSEKLHKKLQEKRGGFSTSKNSLQESQVEVEASM